jgi:hypothetical protein
MRIVISAAERFLPGTLGRPHTVQEILPRLVDACTGRPKKLHLTVVEPGHPSLLMAVGECSGVRSPLVLDGASRVC